MSAISHAIRPSQSAYPSAMEPVTEDIPEEFTCPISGDIMRDPVRISDGTQQCYDRENIQRWFDRCGDRPRSPYTNAVLLSKRLVRAPDIKARIDARASAPSAPPLWALRESPSNAPNSHDAGARGMPLRPVEMPTPSAPPLPSGPSRRSGTGIPSVPAEALNANLPPPSPRAPQAVGATAKDFANVSALARRDLRGAIKKQGTPWTSSVAAATLGAAGGLAVGGAVAGGLALGTLLVPCVGIATGLALVGAGATVGAWLRQRLAGKAQREPHVTEKLAALTEMRSAFEALPHRNKAEDEALAHVNTALGDFDARQSLRRHFTWAAGAAAIALPAGVAAGLFAAAKAKENEQGVKLGLPTSLTKQPAVASAMPPTQRHVHTHYHLPLFPDATWGLHSLWRMQDYASHRPAAAPPMPQRRGVRVAMQPHWLKALDPRSYTHLCDAQGVRT